MKIIERARVTCAIPIIENLRYKKEQSCNIFTTPSRNITNQIKNTIIIAEDRNAM